MKMNPVIKIFTLLSLLLASQGHELPIYVYDTEDNSSLNFADCIYYRDGIVTVKYCIRLAVSLVNSSSLDKECINEGTKRMFSELYHLNITPDEVLKWSSSVKKADDYAAYVSNISFTHDDDWLCNCTDIRSFGKHCEYRFVYRMHGSLYSQLNYQEIQRANNPYETEFLYSSFGVNLCYETLTCNSGLLCLDWHNICDGQQQCIDGMDELNCELLEFNECEQDEYRCVNGMCIPEEFWLDGQIDCMDMTDETQSAAPDSCLYELTNFACDERICLRNQWSCGDGQCIPIAARYTFQQSEEEGCANLRHLNFICEHEGLWTLPNGVCLFENDDDPDAELSQPEWSQFDRCLYIIKCALSNGAETDCPCTDGRSCAKRISKYCTQKSILYPQGALFRPYIQSYYDPSRLSVSDNVEPDMFAFRGSIRCRGYHGSTVDKTIFINNSDELFASNMQDFLFCNNKRILRNTTSPLQLDRNCWNNSRTFTNKSFAVEDVCVQSRECISQYRIGDGYVDCGDGFDERKLENLHNPCINIKQHRFYCSADDHKCLSALSIGDDKVDCQNRRDEYNGRDEMSLANVICNHRSTSGCQLLRNYISNSSINISLPNQAETNQSLVFVSTVLPFAYYCDTIWHLQSHLDESFDACSSWICPQDQYQCRTGHCVPIEWVCDKEWDCPDASDELGFILRNLSDHNIGISELSERLVLCDTADSVKQRQPYFRTCNLTIEYPCLLNNVLDPWDFVKNRPCIYISQVGDGRINCYGGLDERNTLADCNGKMLGYTFRCSDHQCVKYSKQCQERCENGADASLCAYKSKNTSWCAQSNDVVCFDGNYCAESARCTGSAECAQAEDEHGCYSDSGVAYRLEKEQIIQRQNKIRGEQDYPLLKTHNTGSFQRTRVEIKNDNKLVELDLLVYCGRGIIVARTDEAACLCPPAYYGDQCEKFSDRITIHVRADLPSRHIVKVIALLYFNQEHVVDLHEFHLMSFIEHDKQRKHIFYLLHSRSEYLMQLRQQRYLNRTAILEEHPYSVRFEAYELHMNYSISLIGVWQYPIYLDFLPAFRLATILKFTTSTYDPCLNSSCPLNAVCHPVSNRNALTDHICICKDGFYGRQCELFEPNCSTYCSPNSLCRLNYRPNMLRLFCVCPVDHFGPRCFLRRNHCASSPCENNGTCYHIHDYSDGTYIKWFCECTTNFRGVRCEIAYNTVQIRLNTTMLEARHGGALAFVTQYGFLNGLTGEIVIRKQDVVTNTLPSILTYYHHRTGFPYGLLKMFNSLHSWHYFILYIQNSDKNVINITTAPKFCPKARNMIDTHLDLVITKYHLICRQYYGSQNKMNVSDLVCFHDDVYLCICDENFYRANCYIIDQTLDHCSHCLSTARCVRGDLTDSSDFICLCPRCHYGRFCELNNEALSVTLDSLIMKDYMLLKIVYSCVVALLFAFGLINNVCSFVTFKRPGPRKLGVGNCLLIITLLNQTSLSLLLIKIIQILGGTNVITCKITSYLLSVSVRANYWLTSWISVNRLCMIIFPTSLKLKGSRISIVIISLTLASIFGMHVHELLHYTTFDNLVCVPNYHSTLVSTYNRILVLFHHLVPFGIQIISITFLVIFTAKSRAKTAHRRMTYIQVLRIQFNNQKELYLTPFIIVLSTFPQTILSFKFACTELADWQRFLLLATYFSSNLPQMLGFILYVLPSTNYKKELQQTHIGKSQIFKRLFNMTAQNHNLTTSITHPTKTLKS